jgi:hypothetical protein
MARDANATIPQADAIASKMIAGAQNAQTAWLNGVLNPSTDPIDAAIAAAGKWASNVQAAVAKGSYAAGLRKVDKAAMAASITAGGGAAYSAGIASRKDKITNAIARFRPMLVTAVNSVRALPNNTAVDAENRAVAMIRAMRKAGDQFKGLAA